MDADLATFLTPEEWEEWQLRTSDLTAGLRRKLKSFNPDEQEFRNIYKLQAAFDAEWGRIKPTEPARLAGYEAAANQFLSAVKEVLGESRFADYVKATQ